MGVLNRTLRSLFKFIGYRVAKSPKIFAILSVLVSLALGTGIFLHFNYISNVELLYTHLSGEYKFERSQVEKYFPPQNHETFSASRMVRIGRSARIIVVPKDKGTVLRSEIWKEILELDKLVHNTSVEWNETSYQYENICGKIRNSCFENEFLDLDLIMDSFENGTLRIGYPVMFNPITFNAHIIPHHLGGNKLSNDSFSLLSSQAVLLDYIIAVDNDQDDLRGEAWEMKILQVLEDSQTHWSGIDVYRMTIKSLSEEQETNTFSTIPYFVVTVFLMSVFAFATTFSSDCVRSKSWVSQMGIFSAALGTLAGCGILCFLGVELISLNLAVPFIMIGIGIDDTFVMLSSWRKTSILNSVPDRLAECYEDVAVSITITTLTDMLSFYVGLLTPIASVQIFSAYAGTCVLCIYIWHIFFFGAIMSLHGYHEGKNKNSVFWWKTATPKSLAQNKSSMYKLFFCGGISKYDPTNEMDNPESSVMTFFRDSFAPILNKTFVKVLILLIYALYLFASYWGISTLNEGLDRENLVRYDSYLADFISKDNEFFSEYRYRMQVLVTTPLDYSQKENQEKIIKLMQSFYDLDHVTEEYKENWLQDFTTYVENNKEFYNFNVTTEGQFIEALESVYFTTSTNPISLDIAFNENRTKIVATRYIIQIINVLGSNAERDLVNAMRKLAKTEGAKLGLDVVVYHPWYHFIDQFIIIRELTYKLLGVAAVIVMFVATAFLSNIICSLCVFLSIASIEAGVLGLMSLWGVNLDLISVLFLIMCVGFSVDFSSHIAYAYISAKEKSSIERIQDAMYSLGYPILQATGSTIIGVALLIVIPSYIFQTMFKIVVLVMVLAAFHGLFLLPVFLLILKPEIWEISKVCHILSCHRKKKLNIIKLT